MTTRNENDRRAEVENEPTGKALDAWIERHCFDGYARIHSITQYEPYLGALLAWCQDAPRYWDVTFITRKAGISVEVFGWDDFSVLSDAYTDSAQLPAALCQAIYRAVQVREKAK